MVNRIRSDGKILTNSNLGRKPTKIPQVITLDNQNELTTKSITDEPQTLDTVIPEVTGKDRDKMKVKEYKFDTRQKIDIPIIKTR